ncbi:MAG: hypothetical protein JSR57_04620 [Verrucomicrobia bacterium]|nr:hypothetical protein [Verrucomicrobiota bacterium]
MSIQPNYNGQVQGSNASSFAAVVFEEIIPLENEINQDSTHIEINSLKIGKEYNDQQCKDTIREGKKQALGNWIQMGSSLGSATMDGISLGVTANANSGLNEDYAKESGQLKNLQTQQGFVQERLKTGNDIELTEEAKGQRNLVRQDPNVEGRIKEMKDGNFNNSTIKVDDDQYSRSLDETSINATDDDEVAAIKQQLDQQVADKHKAINTIQSQIQHNDTTCRTGFDLGKQALVNAPAQAGQALAAEEGANAKADEQRDQYGQQVQGSVQQSEQQLISKTQDAMTSVYQGLVQAGQAQV